MSQLGTVTRRALGVLVAVGLLGMPGGAWGQEGAHSAAHRAAGTAAEFVLALHPFTLQRPGSALVASTGTSVYCTFFCELTAPFNLPSGAQLLGLELDAFDMNAAGYVIASLVSCPVGDGCGTPSGSSGGIATTLPTAEMPGQVQVRRDLTPPHTIDNAANTYAIQVIINGTTTSTRVTGLRVYYRLQVSPAPTVATFQDVPLGHPFFPHIEALKASGITGGCQAAPPLFCPDAPLTRGQMAAFLAIALGLHFAP